MAYGPSTRTVAQVIAQVRRQFGDEAAVQVVDADIIRWINDAQQVICNRNKPLKARSSATAVVGQSDYTFPSLHILEVDSLHYNGIQLHNISWAEAERTILSDPNFTPAREGAEPTVWWEYAGTFTLYPAPASGAALQLYCSVYPTALIQATDLLGLPDKYYQQVVSYVLQQAYELDEDFQASELKQQQFEAGISNLADDERHAQHATYDTITVLDEW